MAVGTSVVRFDRVTVRRGRHIACEDISLEVSAGSVYVLLGRRGAGKSSLFECLLGRRRPAAGAAYLFNRDIRKTRADEIAKVGIVPQEPKARPWVTPRRLAQSGARSHRGWDTKAVETRLARFQVPSGTPFRRLSEVEKSLAALALALGRSPSLLLLDQPKLGRDPPARRERLEELAGEVVARGGTIFAATDDPTDYESIATHVGILNDGRLVVNEPLDLLRSRFRRLRYSNEITPERSEYGNELDEFDAVRVRVRGWGVEAVVSNFGEEAFARFASIPGLSGAVAERLSLDEVFRAVVGKESEPVR